MIASQYCVGKVPVTLNGESLLPPETLTAFFSLDVLEKQVRQRAAVFLQETRRERREMRARDRRLLAHRQRRQRLCAKRVYQRAQKQGIKASLQWLVDEQRWEQQVAHRLMHKVSRQVADHLEKALPALSWETVLLQQIPSLIEDMASVQRLVLRLPLVTQERARAVLSHLPLVFAVMPEEEGQVAWLENDTARVSIPLGSRLDDLLHQLQNLDWQGEADGRY